MQTPSGWSPGPPPPDIDAKPRGPRERRDSMLRGHALRATRHREGRSRGQAGSEKDRLNILTERRNAGTGMNARIMRVWTADL